MLKKFPRQVTIVKDAGAIRDRLKELGIPLGLVEKVALAWARAQVSTSKFAPKNAPGLNGWIAGTERFREDMSLAGFEPKDENGVPLSVDALAGICFSVTSGNSITGLDYGPAYQPTTKNPKGAATIDRVLKNAGQLDLFQRPSPANDTPLSKRRGPTKRDILWLVMVFVDDTSKEDAPVVRVEVSLPAAVSGERVTDWHERILVGEVSWPAPEKRDDDSDADDSADDFDVPVARKG